MLVDKFYLVLFVYRTKKTTTTKCLNVFFFTLNYELIRWKIVNRPSHNYLKLYDLVLSGDRDDTRYDSTDKLSLQATETLSVFTSTVSSVFWFQFSI